MFIRTLETSDLRLQFFLFAEDPVGEAEVAVRERNGAGGVNCVVEWELGAFDEVVEDGVFEADELVADVGEGEGGGGVREVEGEIHGCLFWKREGMCCDMV